MTATGVRCLLSECGDELDGAGSEGMITEKLRRMERVEWEPPNLSFVVERHGQTVMGSTRAALHRWTIDLDRGKAACNPHHSYRQLYDSDAPLRIKPLVEEIVKSISKGSDDPRLSWLSGERVRILVRDFISGRFEQTQEGRRKRFRLALEKVLRVVQSSGHRDVFQRM